MISFKQKGDFKKTEKFLEHAKEAAKMHMLEEYGRRGVAALQAATPIDTGKTSESWFYKVIKRNGYYAIQFHNKNVQDGVNIAVVIQYGHATKSGRWVEGRDYINPAIQPLFDRLADEAWKEVTKV